MDRESEGNIIPVDPHLPSHERALVILRPPLAPLVMMQILFKSFPCSIRQTSPISSIVHSTGGSRGLRTMSPSPGAYFLGSGFGEEFREAGEFASPGEPESSVNEVRAVPAKASTADVEREQARDQRDGSNQSKTDSGTSRIKRSDRVGPTGERDGATWGGIGQGERETCPVA